MNNFPIVSPSSSDFGPQPAAPVVREQTLAETPGAYQTFEAAKRGGFRGWFYFPNLEPSKQLNSWTSNEINRRTNWLYNNVGVVKSIIHRRARYEAGTGLWPKPRTSKPDWNKAMMNLFHDRVSDASVFDLAGDVNYYSGQTQVLRHVHAFGDHFGQRMLNGSTPAMRFIPYYAVDNAETALDQSLWERGVMSNGFGRALQYRVLQNDRSLFTDVSASDMMRFRNHGWTGQRRGVSMLAHAVKHLFDIDDILFFEKAGVKLSSQIGYVLTVPTDGGGGPSFALPGATSVETVQMPTGEQQTPDERASATRLTIQKIFGQGPVVPELPPGAKLDMVKSDRTSAAFTGFLDFLVRDVALGSDYTSEFLYFLAGVGGAPMRFILDDAKMTISDVRQNLLVPQYCKPFYNFFVWNLIKSGVVDYPGDDWFRADHLEPRDPTVDKAREGKLDDSRYETGKISPRMYYGPMGWDEEEVEDDIIDAYARRVAKCVARGLDPEKVFRPPPNIAAQPDNTDTPTADPKKTADANDENDTEDDE